MKTRFTNLLWILPLAVLVVAGCGKKADTNKPIDEIKAEVENMSVQELESTAKAYASEIKKVTAEADKIKAQLKEIKPAELLSDKTKKIKDELSALTGELLQLSKRYEIYAKQFQTMGGDVSAIRI